VATLDTSSKTSTPNENQVDNNKMKLKSNTSDQNENEHIDKNKKELSKVDGVYLAGNKTRDDIPSHLIIGQDINEDMVDFYTHLCPAGVYEKDGQKLIVNAPNCVDCKATDVIGPRWSPREGGSGPN